MLNLRSISRDLQKGKRTEENLPLYLKEMDIAYSEFAMVKLSMNYYNMCSYLAELHQEPEIQIPGVSDAITDIVKKIFFEDCDNKDLLTDIEKLRNEIIADMEVITAYVDRLQVIEYILNRAEFHFKDSDFSQEYYDEGFERDIVRYILSDKDNPAINARIMEMVGQLPMRLSKNKFFELMSNAFSLYKDTDDGSFDDYVYMLRTSGTIHKPAGFSTRFPNLYKDYRALEKAEYQTIDQRTFDKLSAKFTRSTEFATKMSDILVLFQEIVNDIYTVLLTEQYTMTDTAELDKYKLILSESFGILEGKTDDSAVLKAFEGLEGKQERIDTEIMACNYSADDIVSKYSEEITRLGLNKDYDNLRKVNLLQSGSTFVDLNKKENSVKATPGYIDKTYKNLVTSFSELFESHERLYNRAVMASVIVNFPVFFESFDDVKKYIHVSLTQCSDDAEKKACVELFQMMRGKTYFDDED